MATPTARAGAQFAETELSGLADLVTRHRAGDRPSHRWWERANCRGVDPGLFFPERGASTREAKAVCQGCPVQRQCLVAALANGEKFGIWGGLSERERRRMRRAIALPRPSRRRVA